VKKCKNAFFHFFKGLTKVRRIRPMTNGENQSKLEELLSGGYEFTGRTYKVLMGEKKGREFPIYAQRGDIAGLVYNDEEDKIEMVFKLTMPFAGCGSRASSLQKSIKKPHNNSEQVK
jgi:hypothetical protein